VRPRLLFRTHYQANEPRLLIAAVTRCTSPTESRSENAAAAALERWARNHQYTISTPGAVYAIGNARQLGLLNKTNRWTATGLAFGLLDRWSPPPAGAESKMLLPREDRLFLKVYLLGAGALVVHFANWLLNKGSTTGSQLREESILQKLTLQVLDDYLQLATNIRDRAAIRHERERLARTEYSARTKRDKRYPLLTAMLRLRLLQSDDTDDSNVIRPDHNGRLAALARVIPSIQALERLARGDSILRELDLELKEYTRTDLMGSMTPAQVLLRAYEFAIERGMQACSLMYLDDVLTSVFPGRPTAQQWKSEEMLTIVHKTNPGDVRFHVDRQGRRAFVLISSSAMKHVEKQLAEATGF